MEKINCPACKIEKTEKSNTCNACNFPFDGTDKEKAIHIGQFIKQKGIITDSDNSVLKSQKLLYFISLITLLLIMFCFFILRFPIIHLLQDTVVVAILVFCAYRIKSNPLLYSIIALCLLITVYIFNFILAPRAFLNGLLFKLLIIGTLLYNIYLVFEAKKFKHKFKIDK